jgi:predicted transposase YbfD/YdcC
MATASVTLNDISKHFDNLVDPRSEVNRLYPLPAVVVIAIMGILSGANGPTAIAVWAELHRDFLLRHLNLKDSIPCKDVFRTILGRLQPLAFQACFVNWVQALRDQAMASLDLERLLLHLDGKTLRRSHDQANDLGALHAVSAWASELGLSLAQVACAEKSNEITAIPCLLRLVDIKGAIITIDAMGTQQEIARQIVDGEADYVLALKGNQGNLHDAVVNHLDHLFKIDFTDGWSQSQTITEKLHGHIETRYYLQCPVPAALPMLADWAGLKTIGMVIRHYTKHGEAHADVRYYISSLTMDIGEFARAIRGHWGIENGLHWTLDMTFREDESRIRGAKIRENFAWLNRLAVSLLKQHPAKTSINLKRQSCGWNPDFLMQVLTGIVP